MSTPDLVTIASPGLTARIDPLGAELWSLTDAAGGQWMTDADPPFWTGHAPVLFPIVGALRGDAYRLDGRTFTLGRHGFARRSRFEVIDARADAATFRLVDSAETRAVYPFAFALDMAFRLDGLTLHMEATVANRGDAAMPFSFGFHPAFAWPLPGGGEKLAHEIAFQHDEPHDLARLDDAGLIAGHVASPVRGDRFALSPDLFDHDALIWDRLSSRRLTYRGANGAALDIAFPDTPHLGIWQKPGARYVCIEPWQGLADANDFAGDFRDRPGVVRLPPGESRAFRMDVTVQPG